jgi:hypothetical protein
MNRDSAHEYIISHEMDKQPEERLDILLDMIVLLIVNLLIYIVPYI